MKMNRRFFKCFGNSILRFPSKRKKTFFFRKRGSNTRWYPRSFFSLLLYCVSRTFDLSLSLSLSLFLSLEVFFFDGTMRDCWKEPRTTKVYCLRDKPGSFNFCWPFFSFFFFLPPLTHLLFIAASWHLFCVISFLFVFFLYFSSSSFFASPSSFFGTFFHGTLPTLAWLIGRFVFCHNKRNKKGRPYQSHVTRFPTKNYVDLEERIFEESNNDSIKLERTLNKDLFM